MVLVSYKPNNDIGILQTKLSNREGHEARRVGEEAMPLDEHIEGGHDNASRAWQYAQTRCMTCLKCVINVSIESTVSTSRRSCHAPR